jgi:ribosome-interacting GTPase 1
VPRTERVEVNRLSQVSNPEKDQTRSTSDARRPSVARTCNLIFIVLDVLKPLNDLSILTNELEGFGIRLNKKPPNIVVRKREKGGVSEAGLSKAAES